MVANIMWELNRINEPTRASIPRQDIRQEKGFGILPLHTGYWLNQSVYGAERGNRTPMMSPSRDFESRASTNSAISALLVRCSFIEQTRKAQLSLKSSITASRRDGKELKPV